MSVTSLPPNSTGCSMALTWDSRPAATSTPFSILLGRSHRLSDSPARQISHLGRHSVLLGRSKTPPDSSAVLQGSSQSLPDSSAILPGKSQTLAVTASCKVGLRVCQTHQQGKSQTSAGTASCKVGLGLCQTRQPSCQVSFRHWQAQCHARQVADTSAILPVKSHTLAVAASCKVGLRLCQTQRLRICQTQHLVGHSVSR